jgi:hypothetical protein
LYSGLVYTGSTDGVICCTDASSGVTTRLAGPSSLTSVCGGVHTGKVVGLAVCNQAQLLSVGWDDKMRSAALDTHEFQNEAGCAGQPSSIACAGDLTVVASDNDVGLFVHLGTERVGGWRGCPICPPAWLWWRMAARWRWAGTTTRPTCTPSRTAC